MTKNSMLRNTAIAAAMMLLLFILTGQTATAETTASETTAHEAAADETAAHTDSSPETAAHTTEQHGDDAHGAAASNGHGGKATPQKLLMHELIDKDAIMIPFVEKTIPLPQFKPVEFAGLTLNFSITSHFVFFWFGVLLVTLFLLTYRKGRLVQKSIPAQLVEIYVLFIRDDILKPSMPHHYKTFLPYFATLFILIFIQNFLSLIPFMDHATKNISLTAPLAILSFLIVQYMGLKSNGPIGYLKTMMPISSKDMNPLLAFIVNMMVFPFELLGQFTRPFALAIRLFANMVAGHAVILSFIMIAWFGDHWNLGAAAGGVFMAVFMYLLEILVAFLQAYVFALLTSIFVGSAIESHH